jgi:ethanolamine utilization microcompartment shell protein EutL
MTKKDKTDMKKELMLKCLKQSMGIVSHACEKADTARASHYEWYNSDPEYAAQVDAINESCIDFAESKLMELINGAKHEVATAKGEVLQVQDGPNPTACIFYLKTKGKKRGYVEKSELDVGGNGINITLDSLI